MGLGLVDPIRLGVLGLSYGGFMVHWLIGTSDRFGAAVSENGVANQVSAWANSDSGVEYRPGGVARRRALGRGRRRSSGASRRYAMWRTSERRS